MERLLLRVAEAAELTGIGRSQAYELVASGVWPRVKIGRSVRVPVAELREWVQKRIQNESEASLELSKTP